MADDQNSTTGRRRPRRPVVVLAALVAAASLATGAGYALTRPDRSQTPVHSGGGRPQAGPVNPDADQVTAILQARAKAVRARDRTAFLATVAAAPAAYRAAQRTIFDNLAKLPLQSWQENLDSGLPVGSAADAAIVRTTLRYRLDGFDTGQVGRTRYLAFAQRDGAWAIVGDGGAAGRPDDTEIWDGGPLTVVRGRHSLVAGQTGLVDPRELAERLDTAVPRVAGVLGNGWARRVVALVPSTDARAAALVGSGQSLLGIAALAALAPAPEGRAGKGQDRVVIAPATFARLNVLGREVVLTHELTHVAAGGARDARTPSWLIEGLADYVGYKDVRVAVRSAARELRAEIAAGRVPATLPGRQDFTGGADRLPQVYEEAWLACRMIAEEHGEAALVRLYESAGRTGEGPALRGVLGIGVAEFTAQWRAYLKKELG